MDMDIPAPEELEWLESHSLLPEEEDFEEDYVIEDDARLGEDLETSISNKPDKPSLPENEAPRKRSRLEEKEGLEALEEPVPGDGERETKRRASEDEADEDWLRYSPQRDVVGSAEPEQEDLASAAPQEEKIISRFASEIEGDYVPVTGPRGDRVYAKISSSLDMVEVQRKLRREKPAQGLLVEPIDVLTQRVEQEAFYKALKESSEPASHEARSMAPVVTERLWVEKYAPKSFTELLSNEQTNREVLLWLKQWDTCVFGSQIRATTDDVLHALRTHSCIVQNQATSDSKSSFSKNGKAAFCTPTHKYSDALGREESNSKGVSEAWNRNFSSNHLLEQKVLLLCGPPGLGKTTLAHVAAKHCGYHVVEINASDDRSASTVESKILDAVEMNSVIAGSRPKCLVIDEIDGALGDGKGVVEVILKLATAEKKTAVQKERSGHETEPGKASSKKRHKTMTLSRPVICICNDLYAPALRPLRLVAKVHIFAQPAASRVVNRLKYICRKEGFKTSSIALSALADCTECDIRSCLNTLQFLNKKNESLNILDVSSQIVGRKDMSRSAFDIWKEVFQKRKSKREQKPINGCNSHADFDFLYSLISNRGDYELTMDGIHENFLRLSYHDPMMQKTVKCLDVLGISDSVLKYTLQTQQMSLLAYQPPIAISMSYLISRVEKPNIEWPKSLQRFRMALMERKDLFKSWQNKIVPSISRHISTESFVEDFVSLFLRVLSPANLRPVALHLLLDREKDDLAQLVDTMVSYSITYKSSKPESLAQNPRDGALPDAVLLSLHPPVDQFVNFKEYQLDYSGLSLAMKQVIVHEVERWKIMRESNGRTMIDEGNNKKPASSVLHTKAAPSMNVNTAVSHDRNKKPQAAVRQHVSITSTTSCSEHDKNSPTTGINLRASGFSKKPSSRSSNFFDRFRKGGGRESENTRDSSQMATTTTERDLRPFFFKYNEGFTNAVKRPVKVRELLLL